jgi:hypothetical protein
MLFIIVHAAMSAAEGWGVETQGQYKPNPHLQRLEQMTYGPYPVIPQPTPEAPKQGSKNVCLTMFGGLQKTVPMPSLHYNGQQSISQPHIPSCPTKIKCFIKYLLCK